MSQLTKEERDLIAQMHHRGALQKDIAAALERHPTTIGRELKRNRVRGEYFPAQAHDQAQRRRRQRPLNRKLEVRFLYERRRQVFRSRGRRGVGC